MKKTLLLQIRRNELVKKEELESFERFAGASPNSITAFDCFNSDLCTLEISDYSAIYIGGASEASVLEPETYTFVPKLISKVKEMIDKKIPTFASCFGFQVAVLALGGSIIRDESNFEMGTYQMKLTPKALKDPIFNGVSDLFYAVSVHKEKTTLLPPNSELLAYTDSCVHSFRVKNCPFYAFQFHPELDKKTLKIRLNAYKEKYTQNSNHLSEVINNLKETPYANMLVKNFMNSI